MSRRPDRVSWLFYDMMAEVNDPHRIMKKMERTRKVRKFQKGDLVRIILTRGRKVGPESRAYTPYFSDEI